MKALICGALGGLENLSIRDVPDPVPGPEEILVGIEAAGLNFFDILLVQGKYQIKLDPPFIPGAECAGRVLAAGGDVTTLKPGDRVILSGVFGTFAEKIAAHHSKATPFPETIPMHVAAAFMGTYGTSYHGLKQRGRLAPGETLLVTGAAGGGGLAAVDIGKMMGATVIAAASSAEKLAVAKAAGADFCINYETEDLKARVKEITGGRGVDVVYDPVSGPLAEPCIRALGWDGRYLVIGFTSGDIAKVPMNLPLLKNAALIGVIYGPWCMREPEAAAQNVRELIGFISGGQLKPLISEIHPLADFAAAFQQIEARKAVGKIVLRPSAEGHAS